ARKVADERARLLIRDAPADLLLEHRRVREFASFRDSEQLLVGDAAPKKKRETRSELDVCDPVRGGRRDPIGVVLDSEQELRTDQNLSERELDAGLEPPLLTP